LKFCRVYDGSEVTFASVPGGRDKDRSVLSNCKAAPDYELLLPFIAPRVMRLNGVAGTRHEDPESALSGSR